MLQNRNTSNSWPEKSSLSSTGFLIQLETVPCSTTWRRVVSWASTPRTTTPQTDGTDAPHFNVFLRPVLIRYFPYGDDQILSAFLFNPINLHIYVFVIFKLPNLINAAWSLTTLLEVSMNTLWYMMTIRTRSLAVIRWIGRKLCKSPPP